MLHIEAHSICEERFKQRLLLFFHSNVSLKKILIGSRRFLNDSKVICHSFVLFFSLHFGFGWGEGQVTQRIFFFNWNLFQ